MSSFMKASIGRKFFMSLTGLFLIVFLFVHLTLNLFLTFDKSGVLFNEAAHFMATNPIIKIIEPILALGFIIHIIWSGWITLENMKARPKGYQAGDNLLKWYAPEKNMFILGGMVLIFLIIHLFNFYVKIRFTGDPLLNQPGPGLEGGVQNSYALVSTLFIHYPVYDIIYILGGILIGLHISHGFWSAFHTIGLNNSKWMKRLKFLAHLVAFVIGAGFAYIPLYFLIKF
ncbi:succinate dehydrogenase cytochrome b subunit [Prolixibacter sp. SD074]|uniref:succinate dehydrogenase cytochrome b subunit n=1 Tax=Prolixibacter sp. SD074 TaxID=2652391 RepID=UPI0012990670|nr:succinate dehydrogenase cytochrome b subunit [Prolixibacter sp. SD074]